MAVLHLTAKKNTNELLTGELRDEYFLWMFTVAILLKKHELLCQNA